MKKYEPAIGQIDFLFTSLEILQNVDNLEIDPTSKIPTLELINPLIVAKYALYNTDRPDEDNGTTNNLYLAYEGGFITQGDKINNKRSSFELRGNLTVRQNVSFHKNVDLKNNSVRNIRQKGSGFINDTFRSTLYDSEPLTVGDFRNYAFPRGTIMMWSGTYEELYFNLPNWRLCGRPDSNIGSENGVTIPNLEGYFVIAANYTTNTYTPLDNVSQAFGSSITLSIGVTGGTNAGFINLSQMPLHKHDINHTISGGINTFLSNGVAPPVANQIDIYRGGSTGGGDLSRTTGVAKDLCLSVCPTCGQGGCVSVNAGSCCQSSTCGCSPGANQRFTTVRSVPTSISMTAATQGTLTYSDPTMEGGVQQELNIGNNLSHENRPPFYVLGYIINVGRRRV